MNERVNFDIDITILVTCYNESEFIRKTFDTVIAALHESGHSYEILVIDDVSTDQSVKKINDYIKQNPHIPMRLHVNSKNQGVGSNFIEGAFLGRGKYYRVNDGDCPEPKEALVHLFKQIGKADIIIPNPDLNKKSAGRTLMRRLISKFYNSLINFLSGYRIGYYNGSPIFHRYHAMRWPPFTTGLAYQADLVTRLLDEGFSYLQVPLKGFIEKKGEGSTALSLANYLSAFHTLLEISFRRIKKVIWKIVYSDRIQTKAREEKYEKV